MKHVVSISLGSAKRNHKAQLEVMGDTILLERIGTDGSLKKMIELIKEMDGKVDAFGLGGMDLYIQAVDRRYTIRDAQKVANAAKITPIVDGSGLKNTLERRVIKTLVNETDLLRGSPRVLMVSAMDRCGMAVALQEAGCRMTFGDVAFILGIPVGLSSLNTLAFIARVLVPFIRLLPFHMIYPTGSKQEKITPKFVNFYNNADIVAGDFHLIKRFMPHSLKNKIIITNTVTRDDLKLLKDREVAVLVTTTPEIDGRSFGTNVMEAMLLAIKGSKKELSPEEYDELLESMSFKPRITYLNKG